MFEGGGSRIRRPSFFQVWSQTTSVVNNLTGIKFEFGAHGFILSGEKMVLIIAQ